MSCYAQAVAERGVEPTVPSWGRASLLPPKTTFLYH